MRASNPDRALRSSSGRRAPRRAIQSALLALLGLASVSGTTPAHPRALSWPSVSISAHLDSSGALRVLERQTILLSGDWNGAERTYDLRFGQRLEFNSISRFDPVTGITHPLRFDESLDDIDDFAWTGNGKTLRWRARRPTDPRFDRTMLTYIIDATFDRILVPQGDGSFRLDHNFAMVQREGPIDRLELTLTLDSAWAAPEGFNGRYEATGIVPGDGFLVTLPLRYRGAGAPASVRFGASEATRQGLAAVVVVALLLFFGRLVMRERALGRFAPLAEEHEVTPEFLERQLFSMLPEVAGAMWDDSTAQAEVAAILARLVQEGKLTSKVETKKVLFWSEQDLELTLEVERTALAPHERALIAGLFRDGDRRTSTAQVRARYKNTGFDPAETINRQLAKMLTAAAPGGSKPDWKPTALLLIGSIVLLATATSIDSVDILPIAVTVLASLLACIVGAGIAVGVQRALDPFRLALALSILAMVLTATFGAFVVVLLIRPLTELGTVTLIGLVLWIVGVGRSITNIAASRQSPERIAMRKRLLAARRFFQRELGSERPALKDAWFPYIIGFGLGPEADKWFKAFGAPGSDAGVIATGRSSGGSGASGSGWSGFGGGGGFAGAGSSASFAAAVGGMAASVASPSSSSSGGGSSSSSGGGSSGGGGGGGW